MKFLRNGSGLFLLMLMLTADVGASRYQPQRSKLVHARKPTIDFATLLSNWATPTTPTTTTTKTTKKMDLSLANKVQRNGNSSRRRRRLRRQEFLDVDDSINSEDTTSSTTTTSTATNREKSDHGLEAKSIVGYDDTGVAGIFPLLVLVAALGSLVLWKQRQDQRLASTTSPFGPGGYYGEGGGYSIVWQRLQADHAYAPPQLSEAELTSLSCRDTTHQPNC